MMWLVRRSLAWSVVFVLVGGFSSAAVAQDDQQASERILFVGNSFTFNAGGVDRHFEGLVGAEDDPPLIEVDERTMGGATLKTHRIGTPAIIETGDYSIVVLQGDIPENPERTVDPFLEGARLLDAAARETGASTVFYMTWPYARLGWIGLDGIADAHRQISAELGAPVAPVGLAMANALAERPDLAMLDLDLEHQTVHAAYLAAATIYATIFERSPEGLSYMPSGIDPEDASFLQGIAWRTVKEWGAGDPVPLPEAAAWVSGTESCSFDAGADTSPSAAFVDGVWAVTAPFTCRHRADDPRVTGTAKVVWNCDCQLGIGSPVRGSWELQNDDGSWMGTWQGIRSAEGDQHVLLVAEGKGGYEGLTYVADLTAEGPTTSFVGVISEDGAESGPEPATSG